MSFKGKDDDNDDDDDFSHLVESSSSGIVLSVEEELKFHQTLTKHVFTACILMYCAQFCLILLFLANRSNQIEPKVKKRRTTGERKNYDNSPWGQMLLNDHQDMLDNYAGNNARLFRRRFRIPYPLFFKILVPACRGTGIFKDSEEKFQIPTTIKLLIALRILGRDASADDCTMNSFVGESTCHVIFKQFIKNYSAKYCDIWLKFPDPSEDRDAFLNALETYRMLGLPGAVCSVDATHITLDKHGLAILWFSNFMVVGI